MSADERPGPGREELEAALASLRKVSRSSVGSIALLAIGIVVLVGSIVFGATRLRPLEEAVSAKRDTLSALSRQVQELQLRKAALITANDTLSAVARRSPGGARPSRAVERAVATASNARFGVGFYSLGVSDEQYTQLADSLRTHGYTIIQGLPLTEKPDWLSMRSTVLYYAPAAAADAAVIARQMGAWTGQTFGVSRGAGLGVPKGEERWTFFVHYVAGRRGAARPGAQ